MQPVQVDSTGMMHYLHDRITNSCPEELMLLDKAAQVGICPAQHNLLAAALQHPPCSPSAHLHDAPPLCCSWPWQLDGCPACCPHCSSSC